MSQFFTVFFFLVYFQTLPSGKLMEIWIAGTVSHSNDNFGFADFFKILNCASFLKSWVKSTTWARWLTSVTLWWNSSLPGGKGWSCPPKNAHYRKWKPYLHGKLIWKKNLSWILNFATPSEYGSRMKKKSLSLCQIESRFFFPQLLMHHVSLHMSLNVLTLCGIIWSKRSLAQYQPKEFFKSSKRFTLICVLP